MILFSLTYPALLDKCDVKVLQDKPLNFWRLI